MRCHTLLLPLLVYVAVENARLTWSRPDDDASQEKKASSYEYENWSGIKRHVRDYRAHVGRIVSSAAGEVGLATTGLASNVAVQSLRRVQKTLKSGREGFKKVLNCTRNGIVTGLDYVDRGARHVGQYISRRLAALRDMIFGLEKIMDNRRSQIKTNSAINAANNTQQQNLRERRRN